jgi:ferredoxin-NADP reductase
MDGSPGEGRSANEAVRERPLDKEFFICGPEQMMVNVSEALEKQGVDKKRIHIELFT